MVVADFALAVKNSQSRLNKKVKSSETAEEAMKKLTHLRLHGKNINSIKDLSFCENLKVLYLQDNNIKKIENLDGLVKLRQLYLQNNNIEQIENLEGLKGLSKLYLNNNAIGVIEGLEGLQLEELHISNQRLAAGEKLLFDSRSFNLMAFCLQFLDISNNGLDHLKGLECLVRLKILVASNNKLDNVIGTTDVLSKLTDLEDLDLTNNPINKHPHYKKCILAITPSLLMLDGKKVTEESKVFLQRLRSHIPDISSSCIDQSSSHQLSNPSRRKLSCPSRGNNMKSPRSSLNPKKNKKKHFKGEEFLYNPFWDLKPIRPGEDVQYLHSWNRKNTERFQTMMLWMMLVGFVRFGIVSGKTSTWKTDDKGGHSSEFHSLDYRWNWNTLTRSRILIQHRSSVLSRNSDEEIEEFIQSHQEAYQYLAGYLSRKFVDKWMNITARIKNFDVVKQALIKNQLFLDNINDVIGFRFTVSTVSEARRLKEDIVNDTGSEFEVLRVECYGICLDANKKYSEDGYRRIHLVLLLPRFVRTAEIQIGTPYANFWADWTNGFVRKGEFYSSKEIISYTLNVAEYLYQLDELRDKLPECPEILENKKNIEFLNRMKPPNLCYHWMDINLLGMMPRLKSRSANIVACMKSNDKLILALLITMFIFL